jgi:uncharacterized protein YacL
MINYILLGIFAALQIGDAWTTIKALSNKKGVEANPILAWLFDKIGLVTGLVLIKVVAIGAIGYLIYSTPPTLVTFILVVLNAIYGYVVYLNYRIGKL